MTRSSEINGKLNLVGIEQAKKIAEEQQSKEADGLS